MKFKKVPVSELFVDERYQRPVVPGRVNRIVKHFRPAQLGVLEVSKRDNGYAVFDGQHRLEALTALERQTAPCLIHENLTPEDEAVLFVRHQMDRKAVSPVERFKAEVFAGVDDATTINGIADEYGYEIADKHDAGEQNVIRAVNALRNVYKRFDGPGLSATLETLRDLWYGDQRSTDGYLIEGLAELVMGYGNRLDTEAMDRLAAVSPTVILRRALGPMSGGGSAVRHTIASELRKIAGVRGRPAAVKQPELKLVA